jgi:hypothetical protein
VLSPRSISTTRTDLSAVKGFGGGKIEAGGLSATSGLLAQERADVAGVGFERVVLDLASRCPGPMDPQMSRRAGACLPTCSAATARNGAAAAGVRFMRGAMDEAPHAAPALAPRSGPRVGA